MDKDGSGHITRAEFLMMRRHRRVMRALRDLDITEKQFDMYVELLFDTSTVENPSISFERLLNLILRLRPGTPISKLDFAAFRELVSRGSEDYTELLTHVSD